MFYRVTAQSKRVLQVSRFATLTGEPAWLDRVCEPQACVTHKFITRGWPQSCGTSQKACPSLVDLVRGCATFGLNGLAGPCVRFPPGGAWRDGGVQIVTPPGCIPMASVLGRSLGGRCVISCATPPTPPSMLAAASHPMTAAEHLAAGSLRTVPGALLDAFVD